jgi:uncharacterized protein
MPIIRSEPWGERGKKDARRHREKHREAIKEKLPELIADESIITGRKGKIIKIPIKILDIPHFKPKRDSDKGSAGIGQGSGKPGDVIGGKPIDGMPGEPGTEPGEDYIETEIELEELIELMLEDLGLPKLEEKEVKDLIVRLGWKIHGITRSGPWPLLDRRKTAQEGFKRFWSYLRCLELETGRSELECFSALKQSGGILPEAIEIIRNDRLSLLEEKVEPFPILANEDLRFKKLEENISHLSRAVVIAARDVSGSMTVMKRYLSRALLWWLINFLRQIYDVVETRFIIHHAVAKVVDEETFFNTTESGGTNCYTAYETAGNLIDTEYPTNLWNTYVWHFSAGEDSNFERTMEEVKRLLAKNINMIGYGEVQPTEDSSWGGKNSTLWKSFEKSFPVQAVDDHGFKTLVGKDDLALLCAIMKGREDILPALKAFLKKDRWTK